MKRVLLSASFPNRPDASTEPSAQDIGLAASATIETILTEGGHLIFGGHPSITPLALSLKSLITEEAGVTLYQSHHFDSQITHEVRRLSEQEGVEVVWTEDLGGLLASVQRLRDQMLNEPVDAAFFVGGMSGIRNEFDQLGRAQRCMRFLFTRPGGVAADIAESMRSANSTGEPDAVEVLDETTFALNGRGYARLASRALKRL